MSLIYGLHAVSEAMQARRVTRLVHVRGGGPRIDALVARAHELRLPVETADRRHLDKLTREGVHQGVVAEVQPTASYTLDELVGRRRRRDGGRPPGAACGAARGRGRQGVGRRGQPREGGDGREHLARD
jgi:tRNA G18 (ribose-2'-O)-methylase SpoU